MKCPMCGSSSAAMITPNSYICFSCRYIWVQVRKENDMSILDDDLRHDMQVDHDLAEGLMDKVVLSRAEVAAPVFCYGCVHSPKGFDCERLNHIRRDSHEWEYLVVSGERPECWSAKAYKSYAEGVMGGEVKKTQYFSEFTDHMENRLLQGAMKYGDSDWKFGDNLQDILEEVIDIANYAYFFFSRLRWIEEHGNPPYYLNPCRVKEISHQSPERQHQLAAIFEEYKVCYKIGDNQRHFCLNSVGIEAQRHPKRTEENST